MEEPKATVFEQLRKDHREVLDRLAAFEAELAAAQDDPSARPGDEMRAFLGFIEEEVWTHFRAEEEALFPLLRGIFPPENAPVQGGPVFVLTEEHGVLRRLVTRLKEALDGWAGGRPDARDLALLTGPQVVRAFQKHIYKEDNIVFRLAETHLSESDKSALEAAFARARAQ